MFSHTSGDAKAVVTVHHAPVDPQAVASLHVTQGAVTHLTLQTQANTQGGQYTHGAFTGQ